MIKSKGKSTIAKLVTKQINTLYHANNHSDAVDISIMVPMDGFHYTRKQLSSMSDPTFVFARRGAEFTFDASGYLLLVEQLKNDTSSIIYAPSFDHAIKDPMPDGIVIPFSARILIVEGNYTSFGGGAPEWKKAALLMDELWWVDVDLDVARGRLIKRHVESGICLSEEDATKRVEQNDLVNAQEIIDKRLAIDRVIINNNNMP